MIRPSKEYKHVNHRGYAVDRIDLCLKDLQKPTDKQVYNSQYQQKVSTSCPQKRQNASCT